jgi:hypothetical protein
MAKTWIRQDAQIGSTQDTLLGFVDNTTPAATMESAASTITDDLNNIRSMLSEHVDNQANDWYTGLITPSALETGTERGINGLNTGLHAVEKKRVLRNVHSLVDVTVTAGVQSVGILTLTGQPLDTETVTIGAKVYTFQTALTDVNGNVLIGASASDSLDNLIAAIGLGAGAGTLYATSMTVNTDVSAAAGAGDTMDVTALLAGVAGDAIASTQTLTNGTWGGGTLSGGVDGENWVILDTGELPAQLISATGAVTTLGTVTALHGGSFGSHSLTEVAGVTAISPQNLTVIVDGSTRDPILSNGYVVYGLLQGESGLTDGVTITDATTTRVQISFVRVNATGDDLEAVPQADIEGRVVNYCTRERVRLEDLNEADFLSGAIVDVPAGTTVTRQAAYDNQGATIVTTTVDHTLDVGSGLTWEIGDLASASLFQIIEGSAGGTSQVNINSDVDEFDVDAAVNNFLQGISIDSGGTRPIDVGVTDGVIETTAGDLQVGGANGEVILNDINMDTEGTWTGPGVKVSETTAEVVAYETAFGGEVSLMNAIVQANSASSRTRVQTICVSDITANIDIGGPSGTVTNLDADLPAYSTVTFLTDVDIYLNGELMRNGIDAAANEDFYPGTSDTLSDIRCEFNLKGTGSKPDQITMIVNGQ